MIAGTARAPAYRVAIGGFGTIGAKVARRLDEGIPGLELAAVSARDRAAAADRMKALNRPVPVLTLAELAAAADVVVECAPAAAFDEVADAAIDAGRIFMPMSCASTKTVALMRPLSIPPRPSDPPVSPNVLTSVFPAARAASAAPIAASSR